MKRRRNEDQARSLAMVLMRYRSGWYEKQELAQAAGFTPSQVSMWELGERPIPMDVLERTAEVTGFPPHLLDSLIDGIRTFLVAAEGHSKPIHALANHFASELALLLQESADLILAIRENRPMPVPSAEDREQAAALWARLEGMAPDLRRLLVEEAEEFQSWALCERLAAESRKAVDDPPRALELAELAFLIAERVSGEAAWCWRLEAYALAHVANARHACGDLDGAQRDFAVSRMLWEEAKATPGDPGLLDEAVFTDLSPAPLPQTS